MVANVRINKLLELSSKNEYTGAKVTHKEMRYSMELLYMPECDMSGLPENHTLIANSFFHAMVEKFCLHSLDKLIVTGNEDCEYRTAIQQYGSELDQHITITGDEGLVGAAVVIHGIIDGKIKQRIFVRSYIYSAFLVGYIILMQPTVPPELSEKDWKQGICYILHELGHAVEYQMSYELYNYSPPDKEFNLGYEYEEYILHEAMQLWSEYFAERISATLTEKVNYTSLDNLAEYLNNTPYPRELNKQLNHSYRVTYFLVFYLASLHTHGQQFALPDLVKYSYLHEYEKVFRALSDTLFDFFSRTKEWDFENDVQRLVNDYMKIIEFEREIYM